MTAIAEIAPQNEAGAPAPDQPSKPPRHLAVAPQPPSGVNEKLTPALGRANRRTGRYTDDPEFAAGTARMIRQLGERAGATDASVLKSLIDLHDVIDEAVRNAARELNADKPGLKGLSWQAIGDELGMTRQAAWQKWGRD